MDYGAEGKGCAAKIGGVGVLKLVHQSARTRRAQDRDGCGRRMRKASTSLFDRRCCQAVRTAGAACLGAGAKCLLDDGLDGASAAAAVGAATKAVIKLPSISRQGSAGAHGIADVAVAEHVAGTDDHLRGGYIMRMRNPSQIGCDKRERLRSVGLAERERQQARAQQHKAGRRQREESIGNQIMILHDTPST